MQKILVTGGLGYIGSHFIDSYKDKFQIHVIDTNYFQNNINDLDNITYKDVRQIEKKDLKDMEVIIHMGELSNDPLGDLNKNITKKINNDGTINLLKLADKSDVKKFIYMSSASVYGFSDEIMNETSEVNPLTEYSRAKVANETYIINNEFSFETIILRNSTAFGFSSNLRLDLVVNDLTYNGYFNQSINLLSDGTPKRPIVHIHDICKIIYAHPSNFLNPLYLKDWDQLKKFGVQTLIVFQNLIPYEKLNYNDPSYDDVAVSVKVIDLSNGDIIALSGITNIE